MCPLRLWENSPLPLSGYWWWPSIVGISWLLASCAIPVSAFAITGYSACLSSHDSSHIGVRASPATPVCHHLKLITSTMIPFPNRLNILRYCGLALPHIFCGGWGGHTIQPITSAKEYTESMAEKTLCVHKFCFIVFPPGHNTICIF